VNRGATTDTYTYDANGNMTCRVEAGQTYVQSYNVENRMSTALLVSGTCAENGTLLAGWVFTYDGDGNRVEQEYTDGSSTLTTYYFAEGTYEVRDDGATETVWKYYAFAGMTVAMNDGSGLKYLLTDHLGSIVAVTNATGTLLSEQRYMPFGQVRTDVGSITQTDFGYTGQRNLDVQENAYSLGLMDYKARFFEPYNTHAFTQPDSIVPDLNNPQHLNRYAYVVNNPMRNNDPSGHMCSDPEVSLKSQTCDGSGATKVGDRIITSVNKGGGKAPQAPAAPTQTAKDKLVDNINGTAAFFQFLALVIDVPIGGAEIITAGIACGVTIEVGCIPGAGEVILDFDLIYNTTPLGPAETGFSFISSALTITADFLDDGKFGEATNTAIFTFLAGAINPDPALDAAIDLYGMGYATGAYNGIDTIMNGGPILKKH
jgi:RHS repeat-associated protein